VVGTTLGHYRLLELLGKGGMGEVYLAEDTRLQRRVALKVLSPELANDHDRVQRFEREARAAASLNHPNIVTIHSVETEGAAAFLTLELVEGQTLAEMLPPSGLAIDRLLSIAIPLTDAVGAAHQRGIVHRDLKPANVMITGDGRVKVLDFGLAKLRDDAQFVDQTVGPTRALTGEGRILGTVAYMSPEQAEGRNVDQRSDVFSLGVMLYELATGERPFKGDTAMSILSSIMRDTPRPVSEVKRELPSDFARIVRRCLAKDPEDRYQTAKDLRNDLRGLREDLESGERASVNVSSSASVIPPSASIAGVPPVIKPKYPFVVTAVAAVIVIAAAIGGWLLWRVSGPAVPAKPEAFATIGLTRLTTTGTAGLAAISQDGRYVAHVVTDGKGSSLWLRQVSTSSNVQIVPPAEVRYAALAFSPNGDYVYYVIYPQGGQIASLQQIPVLGGGTRKLVDDIDSAPGVSPDGKQIAFVRGAFPAAVMIMLANADGGAMRQLAERKSPLMYQLGLQSVAWSPDGKTIAAVGIDNAKLTAQIVSIDASTGAERPLGSTWRLINSLAWTADGRDLIISAQESCGETGTQIWIVAFPAGTARKLTNDLSTYAGVSLSRDDRSLVTVRSERRSSIWITSIDGKEVPHMVPNGGADDGVQGVAWAPDGRVVFTSTASGNADIWIMNADGSNRVQLTTAREDDIHPTVTPDGRYIVFESERDGARAVWRMDTNGGGQTRIADRAARTTPFGPAISSDSHWVFFTDDTAVNVKVAIDGTSTVPVFDSAALATLSALAPNLHDLRPLSDGTTVTGHYNDPDMKAERLIVIPLADPAKAHRFPKVWNNALEAADGRTLIYTSGARGVGNMWRQSLAGGDPTQLTRFESDAVFYHALAFDKQHVAIVRGQTISDVILIADKTADTSQH